MIQAHELEDATSCIIFYIILRGSLRPSALILRTLYYSCCSHLSFSYHVSSNDHEEISLSNPVEDRLYGILKLGCGSGVDMNDDIRVLTVL